MTRTGYSHVRAAQHDELIEGLVAVLDIRGYRPRVRQVDGDEPDIEISDHVRSCVALVDLKVPTRAGYAVKQGALETYWRITLRGTPVYIVWWTGNGSSQVDNVFTLSARIQGGPKRPTGNGSATDWLLFERGGTPFDAFFVDARQESLL